MVYKKGDYSKYHKSPRMRKERGIRVQNRRNAIRAGVVRKGDGTHIDHVDGNPRNNSSKNLRVISAKRNRRKQ